jgi:hypothetical protein
MTNISINLGDAFLINTPPKGEHLYIAIAKTSENCYLFVNVTSRRRNSEDSCILMPGSDVPNFIVRESVIAYQYAREMDAIELASLITVGSPIPKGSCSAITLERIQKGGLASKRLMNKYKTALKTFLEIP